MKKVNLMIIISVSLILILLTGCKLDKADDLPPPPPPIPTEGMDEITGAAVGIQTLTGELIPTWAASPGFESCVTEISYDIENGLIKKLDPAACGAEKICAWGTGYYLQQGIWGGTTGQSDISSNQGWYCSENEFTITYPISLIQQENYMLQYFCSRINEDSSWYCPNENEQKWILETTIIEGLPEALRNIPGWALIGATAEEALYYKDGAHITATIQSLDETELADALTSQFTAQDWNSEECYFADSEKLCFATEPTGLSEVPGFPTGPNRLICFDTTSLEQVYYTFKTYYQPSCGIINTVFGNETQNETQPPEPTEGCGNNCIEPSLNENCEPKDYKEGEDYVCITAQEKLNLSEYEQADLEALEQFGIINEVNYAKLYNLKCSPTTCQCEVPETEEIVSLEESQTQPAGGYCGDSNLVWPVEECEWFTVDGFLKSYGCSSSLMCGLAGGPNPCKCIEPAEQPLGNPPQVNGFGLKGFQKQDSAMSIEFMSLENSDQTVGVDIGLTPIELDCANCYYELFGVNERIKCNPPGQIFTNAFIWVSARTDPELEENYIINVGNPLIENTWAGILPDIETAIRSVAFGYIVDDTQTEAYFNQYCAVEGATEGAGSEPPAGQAMKLPIAGKPLDTQLLIFIIAAAGVALVAILVIIGVRRHNHH